MSCLDGEVYIIGVKVEKKYSVFLILDVAKVQALYTRLTHINHKENEIGFLNGNCRYMSNYALHSFDQQGVV